MVEIMPITNAPLGNNVFRPGQDDAGLDITQSEAATEPNDEDATGQPERDGSPPWDEWSDNPGRTQSQDSQLNVHPSPSLHRVDDEVSTSRISTLMGQLTSTYSTV